MSHKHIPFSPKVIVLLVVLGIAGCSTPEGPKPAATTSNTAPPASAGPIPSPPRLAAGKHAAMIASPNPIKVCDGSGLGVTHIAYTLEPPVLSADVRVDSPGGPQLAGTPQSGVSTTGKWTADGMVFYLQDTTGGKSLTPENTLATVTVRLTQEGCP
ncbi:MAG: hypothetical protein AABN95_16975 [Acidobacteriota bacterium]